MSLYEGTGLFNGRRGEFPLVSLIQKWEEVSQGLKRLFFKDQNALTSIPSERKEGAASA